MGKKSQVILSIGISLIIMTAISYFMIPYLVSTPTGLILQSTTVEHSASSLVEKFDDDLNETIIPDMETSIATEGDSKLEVMFSAQMYLYIHPNLIYGMAFNFNVTLEIEGVANQSIVIFYQRGIDNSSYVFAEFRPISILLRIETPTLPEGTYPIKVWWRSLGDAGGSNRLMNGNVWLSNPYFLNVKEISV